MARGVGATYAGEGQCLLFVHRPSDHENLDFIGPKLFFSSSPYVLQPQAPDSKSRDLSAVFGSSCRSWFHCQPGAVKIGHMHEKSTRRESHIDKQTKRQMVIESNRRNCMCMHILRDSLKYDISSCS